MSVLVGIWEELDGVFPPCETEGVVALSSVGVVAKEPDTEFVGEFVVEVFDAVAVQNGHDRKHLSKQRSYMRLACTRSNQG
jgi:hypothetical protein